MHDEEVAIDNQSWTPADLLQLSGGYWSACALHAGVKLDLFTPLAEKALTSSELAGIVKVEQRGLSMLLTALAAMNLLEKLGGSYAATPFAANFLARTAPGYLGHIILHHHHLMSSWAHLDEAVKSGRAIRGSVSHGDEEEARESFLMGMFNLAMQIAPRIATHVDLSRRRRMLDLGGGPGTYAIHFCQRNPQLSAVIFDLPTTRRFAEETVTRFGLADRISFREGDFISGEIEGTYDVAWLSHILHGESPQDCALVIGKAVKALEPGGMILIQEFILDDTMDGPLFPALFSLNMLLVTPGGKAYSQGEIFAMLAAAGVANLQRIPMELPNGAGIISGTIASR